MRDRSPLSATRDTVLRYLRYCRDLMESRNELAALTPADIDLLAADCGLSSGQFRALLLHGPHAADELAELMKALEIDEARLKSVTRGNSNDMRLVCAECGRKPQCRASIRNGTIAQDYGSFCGNAELLREVKNVILPAAV
jgi:hypothetical protein